MNRLSTSPLAARPPRRPHPRAGCAAAIVLVAALIGCAGGQPDGSARQPVGCGSKAPAPEPLTRDAGLHGRIVWASDRADGNFDLYMMRADGSGVRRLTRTPANEF